MCWSVGRWEISPNQRVFGVTGVKSGAHVSDLKPGTADTNREFVSEENKYFTLHDSQGFEPGETDNFDIVSQFVLQRSKEDLPLKDRLHAVWLCTETPTAGGRVFETGDEKLLKLAHKIQTPIVIVFTQYDRLVRTKKYELESKPGISSEELVKQSAEKAQAAYDACLQSVKQTMDRLNIPMPCCAKVSIRRTYEGTVSSLIEDTRDLVKERLEGDAWIMWAMAQRKSLPIKLDACINCMNRQWIVLAGSIPGLGQVLLRECLKKIHRDIIICWNFKDEKEILISDEFKQLMLYLVQDVQSEPRGTNRPKPKLDPISQFVTLMTAASSAFAPPVAILGLTYVFLEWLSDAILENKPRVQQLLMAYTADLMKVLRELFYFTLKPDLTLTVNWDGLKEAFATYEYSSSRQNIHNTIRSNTHILSPDLVDDQLHELLDEAFRGA